MKNQTLKLTLKDGTKVTYIGEASNTYAHGRGKMIYEDGNYEIGEFINNEPNRLVSLYNKKGELQVETHYSNKFKMESKLVMIRALFHLYKNFKMANM